MSGWEPARRLQGAEPLEVGELLVCWTGRLATALDAYRVAVLWADSTCGYITAGRFDTAAEPGDVPAPETGSVLGQICAR